MLHSILKQSFINQKRAMLIMVASVAMGTAISAALITLSLDISGKVTEELRAFGANITVEPRVEGLAGIAGQERYLRQEDLVKAKTIFWRHNIVGLAPFLMKEGVETGGGEANLIGTWWSHKLPLPGETSEFEAGVATVMPWWDIRGEFPDEGGVMPGVTLAGRLGLDIGDSLAILGREYEITGVLTAGGDEDEALVMDLGQMQAALGLEGSVSLVRVSALTTPMDDFAYKDPEAMSPAEYEKWYCTGYITSIAKQLEEVFKGSRVKPVWKVAQTEGAVLKRLTALVYLLSAVVLLASALGMSTTMAASILRRLDEVGLMKALGAGALQIVTIFLSEALLIGLVGGIIGYCLSIGVTHYIGRQVFNTELADRGLLLPVALLSALAIASIASLLPVRRALKVKTVEVLKW